LPAFALVTGHKEVAADDIMVCDILDHMVILGVSRGADMLQRTVASSKKNSLAGRFSKRLTVTWGSFCAWTKREGRRRAAMKLALIVD